MLHIWGRSDILDKLKWTEQENEQPVAYDLRSLANEILLRTGTARFSWETSNHTIVELLATGKENKRIYELLAREPFDLDTHLYRFGMAYESVFYEFPIGTYHRRQDNDQSELWAHAQTLLLTGPVPDRVNNIVIERFIQRKFAPIAGALTVAYLTEQHPEFKAQKLAEYLQAGDDRSARDEIIRQLYEKVAKNELHVGPNQFSVSFDTEILDYRKMQKQLTEKPHSPVADDTAVNPPV
ncbi:MAG TPA: hypothetical protein VMT96_01180 [Candidatus Bathyarchaeia archaeon]|nr:hypothetical protein [Candidatus Bathyarchaeia archaeon]